MKYIKGFIPLILLFTAFSAYGQTTTFTRDDVEYTLVLPSTEWHPVSRFDIHSHIEFVNGSDYKDGHLRLRKRVVTPGTTPLALFHHDERWELQSLPGYVVCSNGNGVKIDGQLSSTAFAYEYVSQGRAMDGRIYYVQVNSRLFYMLHFTVASNKLSGLRPQMDFIARSFRLK